MAANATGSRAALGLLTSGFNAEGRQSNIQFQSRASFFAADRSMKQSVSRLVREAQDNESEKTHKEEVWLFKKVDELGPGQSFGQADLVQSKPHLVMYQSIEDSDLAVINRESYVRIVEKAVKRDFIGRIQFLKTFKALQSLS